MWDQGGYSPPRQTGPPSPRGYTGSGAFPQQPRTAADIPVHAVGSQTFSQEAIGWHRPDPAQEHAKDSQAMHAPKPAATRTPLLPQEQHHVFKIAQLKKVIPAEDAEHLDHIDCVLKWQKERIRELEMQQDANRMAELERQARYYSERCSALELMIHDQGLQSPPVTQADANNAERVLKDQGVVIAQLQDAVQTLTNQLRALTDSNSNYAKEITAANAARDELKKENDGLNRKLEQAIHLHTARSEHYAQRLLDAAAQNSSLEASLEETKHQCVVREDVIHQMEHEVQVLRRGRSTDARGESFGPPGSPLASHRGISNHSNPGTPRTGYRAIHTVASTGQPTHALHPIQTSSSNHGTPRLTYRSPPQTLAANAGPPPSSCGSVTLPATPVMIWAPEQRGPVIVGRGPGIGTSAPPSPGQLR